MKHTLSLLHFNPQWGLKDVKGIEWEVYGNPRITSDNFVMGGGAVYFDGNLNYLYTTLDKVNISNLLEFTVDWYECILDNRYGNSPLRILPSVGPEAYSFGAAWSEWSRGPNGGTFTGIRYYNINNNVFNGQSVLGDYFENTWVHRAIVRTKDDMWLSFQNGILRNKIYSTQTISSAYNMICIGSGFQSNRAYMYLSELRVSNIARWTSDFIPHKYPYSDNLSAYEDHESNIYGM